MGGAGGLGLGAHDSFIQPTRATFYDRLLTSSQYQKQNFVDNRYRRSTIDDYSMNIKIIQRFKYIASAALTC
jgi:hypothetical protein